MMIAATAVALVLAVEPLREKEVVVGEIAHLETLRPKPWLYAVAGGLTGAGAGIAIGSTMYQSGGCSSYGLYSCSGRGDEGWSALTGVGLTVAALSLGAILTLVVVRTVYGVRIGRLEDELSAIDERQRELENVPAAPPAEAPPPPSIVDSRLPPAPVMLSWSFAL